MSYKNKKSLEFSRLFLENLTPFYKLQGEETKTLVLSNAS